MSPRILTIDIETSPNLAHVWSLWGQNVSLNQLRESGDILCFAAKWHGEKKVLFYSVHHDGYDAMVRAAHELLTEADIVVTYNGIKYDIPWLNRIFVESGMEPPAPFKQVDLCQVVKRQFKFPSNKLDYVVQRLRLGAKTAHTGHQLWVDVLAGKAKAWALMKKYNIQDVVVTEKLYDKLLAWIPNHPNLGVYTGEADICPNCGSDDLKREGWAYTAASKFQRHSCRDCGKWSRSNKKTGDTTTRRNV